MFASDKNLNTSVVRMVSLLKLPPEVSTYLSTLLPTDLPVLLNFSSADKLLEGSLRVKKSESEILH
jgi:hypothetical protein